MPLRITHVAGLTLLAIVLATSSLAAQSYDDPGMLGKEVTITLTNGNTITGTLVDNAGVVLVIDSKLLGRIQLPRTTVVPLEAAPPAGPVEPVSPWSGSADAMLNTSSGNTHEVKFRGQVRIVREDDAHVDSMLAIRSKDQTYSGPGKSTTKDETYIRLRREWKIDDSKWSPFVQVADTSDKFFDYSHRIEAAAGAGYVFVDEVGERFVGRVGAGANKKVGAVDDSVTYEALLGVDYSKDITATQHVALESTLFPSLSHGGDYRLVSSGEWRFDTYEGSPWYLKLGASHTHDNQPDPSEARNNLAMYAGIGTSF